MYDYTQLLPDELLKSTLLNMKRIKDVRHYCETNRRAYNLCRSDQFWAEYLDTNPDINSVDRLYVSIKRDGKNNKYAHFNYNFCGAEMGFNLALHNNYIENRDRTILNLYLAMVNGTDYTEIYEDDQDLPSGYAGLDSMHVTDGKLFFNCGDSDFYVAIPVEHAIIAFRELYALYDSVATYQDNLRTVDPREYYSVTNEILKNNPIPNQQHELIQVFYDEDY